MELKAYGIKRSESQLKCCMADFELFIVAAVKVDVFDNFDYKIALNSGLEVPPTRRSLFL